MNFEKMISEEEINNKILELSSQINKYYNDEELCVICVLKGAAIFTCDLIKKLKMPVILDYLVASSYEDKTYSSGIVKISKDIDININGKNVLVIDDIIDTGYTLDKIVEYLKEKAPKSIKTCTLFDKSERRKIKNIEVDFKGIKIPNEFIFGYGLDYCEKYRNLPFISKLIK